MSLDIQELNLCPVTRSPEKVRTLIKVMHPVNGYIYDWIQCGEVELNDNHDHWILQGKAPLGIADVDHHDIRVFRIRLIGLTFCGVNWGTTLCRAWIDPHNGEFFRVPTTDNLSFEGDLCEECEKPHMISEQGLPPFDESLFNKFRGLRVTIRIGPP